MPITFRQLKLDVVTGYRRHTTAVGSTSSNLTTTTFADTMRQEPARYWSLDGADVWVKFTGSTNDGLVRRVTGYSTNSTFVFAPAVTASIGAGAAYQLFKGPHPDTDVGPAINETIRMTFPNRVVSAVATTHMVADTYTYSIPSAVQNTITQLKEIRASYGTINSDHSFRILRDGMDYELLDTGGSKTLQLQFLPTPSLVMTFIGERVPSEFVADTDTTDEPQELILAGARHFLAIQEGNAELASYWMGIFKDAQRRYNKEMPARELKRPHFDVGSW